MSKKENVVKSKTRDHFTLTIDKREHTDECQAVPEPKPECKCPGDVLKWKLEYDYNALGRIEDAIGVNVVDPKNWEKMVSGKNFPALVWGGLARYNPEVTIDEVKDVLNPEAHALLSVGIFKLLYPGAWEAFEKQQEQGASQAPNVETATQGT